MADVYPVAGMKMYIGGVMASKATDFAFSDFASQVWTLIDGWETMGPLGDAVAEITTPLINRGRDFSQKGTANAPTMSNQFAVLADDPGQVALIAAGVPSNKSNYAFKIEGNEGPQRAAPATVTISIASPGVVSWAAHGLAAGDPVQFLTTGKLPDPLVAGKTYYVAAPVAAGTFSLAATPGGAAIATTGTQSGVHSGFAGPASSQRMFIGLVMGTPEQGGGANTAQLMSGAVKINSNIVRVPAILS